MPRTLLNSKPTHEKRSAEDHSHVLSFGTTPLCLAAKAFYVVQLRAKSYEVASMPVQPMMHIPPSIGTSQLCSKVRFNAVSLPEEAHLHLA